MPIKTVRITRAIYHHQWQGHVNADEVIRSFELEKKLCAADQCDKYVVILDGSEIRTMPFNITKLNGAFSGNELVTLIYKAPSIGHKLGEIISSMVKLPFEFYDDWDETVARAHQLIEEHQALIFKSA